MTLWGGRFGHGPSESVWDFTTDVSDRRLLGVDIEGSVAHVTMLGETGIVTAEEARQMKQGLETILKEAEGGDFLFRDGDEDVHTAVERRLGELVGDVAGKLHTGRSRNDQVALDLRLYLRKAAGRRIADIRALITALVDQAEAHSETIIPSYTHLQQAQPTTLGHHLLAYAWMLLRDGDRFQEVRGRIDVSPLGSGASSGSSLPLDRASVAGHLDMVGIVPNSLDGVAARDFVSEYVFCCAQTGIDLSRLAEEIVLWATAEFSWVDFPDSMVTGSSALPHKRNVDAAELARGRSAGVIGDLISIMTLQRSLPLAYNRDLQEDKSIVFHADDTMAGVVGVMTELISAAVFDPPEPESATVSLDLAEALVERGVPFRSAHHAVGGLILSLEKRGSTLADATIEDLKSAHEAFIDDDLLRLDPKTSVGARRTAGSGTPESVLEQVSQIRRLLT